MHSVRACPVRCLNFLKLLAANHCIGTRPSLSSPAKVFLRRYTNNRILIPRALNSLPTSTQDPDIRDCNVMIKTLGRCGKVEEARKVFDDMPRQDAFSYSSMIKAYLEDNDLPKAEQLFWEMPGRNVGVDSAMIGGYAKAGRMGDAQKVFDEMTERNVYSWTSLVSGYFRSGQVDKGLALFEQMPDKNVVSWTTVVQGYACNSLIDRARKTFDLMPEKNIVAWTVMIKSYIENGRLDDAEQLFKIMPQKNTYSWNVMIHGLMDGNRVTEAIQMFNMMPQRNEVSWTIMVTGLARNGMTKNAREYFEKMPNKDITSWNAMVTAYVDEGLMVEANEIFSSMPRRNIVTWNAIIDGYARHGPEGEALRLLIHMRRSGFRPNEMTITSALTSCEGTLEVMQAHALIIPLGFELDMPLANALITMYSRNGDLFSARLVFENLKCKDVVSWTAMILSYANHGHGHHALHVFARMLRAGATPDNITFVGVLSACSHAGMVKKGRMLFDSMVAAYALEPKAEHYCCLVDMLGRAGQVEEALEVFSKMPLSEQDGAVLGALLGACRFQGYDSLANLLGEKLIELEPAAAGPYVLSANVFAASGKWSEFARVRKKMKEQNVRKVPGFSQIEVNGKSHVFFAGDRSHPEMERVYRLLQEKLMPLLLEMGSTKEKRPMT
ncbi:pentatricopeptide repeat-containing protein At1g09410, mitochondrial-like [Rhodamnia argentea]|uniref:Pentatricopeptide repeat-containing protein At1g09410, mitochondrial-like n=1 Tax=Rhodamnia argentea TaxID=178133 RepID=A0A8B8QJK8_9MYRT|nr:pentatricopeptide repeat-containing protein At1g09410, mitochondrial-like [Rhodamnia argentea]